MRGCCGDHLAPLARGRRLPLADDPPRDHGLGPRAAAVLVFGSSAAVLVVEIVALRLLAPYLGLTLETSTMVIGIALTAIALGSWLGGRIADQVDPHRLIGPALGVSGVVVALTPLLLRTAAQWSSALLLLVASATLLVPGALLSAVTPFVTKLRLTSLAETGTVVGRLSGVGTFGAIVGTVLTGFVLVSRLPVSSILIGLGTLLVLGAALAGWRARRWRRATAVALATVVAGSLATAFAPGGCDAETRYHCAQVVADPERDSGRTLVLDGLSHSYVDVEDPAHLKFAYVRAIASVVDTAFPAGEPLTAHHIGGGGLTFPATSRPHAPGPGASSPRSTAASCASTATGWASRRRPASTYAWRTADWACAGWRRAATTWWWATPSEESACRGTSRRRRRWETSAGRSTRTACTSPTSSTTANWPSPAPRSPPSPRPSSTSHSSGSPRTSGWTRPRPPSAAIWWWSPPACSVDTPAIQEALDARDVGWKIATGDDLVSWTGDARVLTDDHAPVDQLLQPSRTRTAR